MGRPLGGRRSLIFFTASAVCAERATSPTYYAGLVDQTTDKDPVSQFGAMIFARGDSRRDRARMWRVSSPGAAND